MVDVVVVVSHELEPNKDDPLTLYFGKASSLSTRLQTAWENYLGGKVYFLFSYIYKCRLATFVQ
jgi:hypothetical protein